MLLALQMNLISRSSSRPRALAFEKRPHWDLDVTFGDDQFPLRKGHGARNMASMRHFALNLDLVRSATDRRSLKSRRSIAGWDTI